MLGMDNHSNNSADSKSSARATREQLNGRNRDTEQRQKEAQKTRDKPSRARRRDVRRKGSTELSRWVFE
jgi:hypothetical protein